MRSLRSWLAIALVLACSACVAQDADSAQTFWASFRQAALANDISKVASMTRFPFELRGVSDSDPVQRLSRGQFPDAWKRLLAQVVDVPEDGRIVERSMQELVHDQQVAPPVQRRGATALRFQQFEFERVRGRWLFTRGYLEE
jgi:hypothetical protein